MRDTLRSRKVQMLSQQELLFAQEKGIPVIDIRPPDEFKAGHIKGSIHVPLYRPITGWDARKFLRRAGFAFFGVFNGTELNPTFFEDIAAAASKEKGAVLVCNIGGTIEATETNSEGFQSRSLMAAYELTNMGFDNLKVLKGGFNLWKRSERVVETEDEAQ
ncbi:g10321 [Coccomyxa elongata]